MKAISSNNQSPLNIGNFDFLLSPISLTLPVQSSILNSSSMYILELDKGPQHIKRIHEKVELSKGRQYFFKEHQQIKLKIHNRKTANYSFTLYGVNNGEEEYMDTLPLNILSSFQQYIEQLSQHSEEYQNLINQISNNLPLGGSWSSLKGQFKHHNSKLTITNQSKSISLQYSLSIINQIDRYAEKEVKKIKVQTKTSRGSKKSTSSVNSKKQKPEEATASTFQQKSELKIRDQSKPEAQNNRNDHLPSRQNQQHINKTPQRQVVNNSQNEGQNLFLPLQQIFQRKIQNLSDIIEATYEGESNYHSGEHTDRQQKELQEIKQEMEEIAPKRKTQVFLSNIEGPIRLYKRNNSLEEPYIQYFQQQFTPEIPPLELNKDPFEDKPTCHQPEKPKEEHKNKKGLLPYLILISIVCILFFGFSLATIVKKNRSSTQRQSSRQTKMHKKTIPKIKT